MSRIVLLDTGPLGMMAHPRANPAVVSWMKQLLQNGVEVRVPEIADYELRRELLRANLTESVKRLDHLKNTIGYIPLTTATMLKAAEFWASARNRGRPTADDQSLDCDMILAAQAALVAEEGDEAIIATANVGHLSLFVDAHKWENIR